MDDANDMLFLWWFKDSKRYFRLRGFGPEYKKFYETYGRHPAYECIWDDFPWDCFVINDRAVEETMMKEYESYIEEDIYK